MPAADLAPLQLASRIGLAFAMAVFLGLAFEGVYKREERTSPGGIRTFPMLAVLGTVLYLLAPESLLAWLIGLAAVAAWLYAYVRTAPVQATRPGFIVPTANLLAYTFGPIALREPPWIVVSAAVAAVLLLESRQALHRLVLRVPSDEVFTLGKFLILIGVILPLLPRRAVVSWTPITPFDAWLALLAVSSLSYASYLLQRYLPGGSNALWPAVLGGAYSSTATTVALAREQRESAQPRTDLAVGIVLATAIMFLRIELVVALFNARLALALLPALGALALLSGLAALLLWHTRPRGAAPAATALLPSNPLQLGPAALFALLFVALTLASGWARAAFGARGIYTLSGISGLTDIDPLVLSLAQGAVGGMGTEGLAAAVLIAASSNNLVKAAYALAFGGARAALRPALVLAGLGVLGLAAALLAFGTH